jgi:hypothetical protein
MGEYRPERSDAFERLIAGEIDLETYQVETSEQDVAAKLLERARELQTALRERAEENERVSRLLEQVDPPREEQAPPS